MARKATNEAVQQTNTGSGVSVYIGPSVRGIIQTATIFEGSPEDAINSPIGVIACKQRPSIKDLIVDADHLPDAQIKVKTRGELLYEAYRNALRGN